MGSKKLNQFNCLSNENKLTWDCMAIITTIIFFCFFLQSASVASQSFSKIGRSMLKLLSNPAWELIPPVIEFIITIRRSESDSS